MPWPTPYRGPHLTGNGTRSPKERGCGCGAVDRAPRPHNIFKLHCRRRGSAATLRTKDRPSTVFYLRPPKWFLPQRLEMNGDLFLTCQAATILRGAAEIKLIPCAGRLGKL